MCPHIRWTLESTLGVRVGLDWAAQPAERGAVRAELTWHGEQGTGARIASALRAFTDIRFEVTEEPSLGADGSRWSHTPSLGIHHAWVGANGDTVVNEDRLREVVTLAQGSPEAMAEMIEELLGADWDAELEAFRYAGEGAPVRWLHKVG
ncbi:conserved hypothetical protein [Nostocoides japonicum T1-X7]|uniref:DUF3145 domain-containing protein n=1 Tax=Nostocoides japonicum T1-X7 TaxID=1194083 RepID=A0A077M2E8_9MICO|nr:conserved hypothetical protein [Tetrasphaera japonica T1-X7]